MTDEQFDTLVRKLEGEAYRNPSGYQFKVLLLALLGEAYIVAVLLFLVALLTGLIASIAILKGFALKLIFAVGLFLWMVVKAIWVKMTPPEGTEIKPDQAPELFAMIDELRRNLKAPRFHHVLVDEEFNAGVVQTPRLGIFGWHRNYLLIGLPLMKSLSADQFKSVLAHEFGHLAKGHGRVANWIYRQRLRWSRLLDTLEATESGGSFLFKPFLNRFSPYFSAYSFPLARANEYEADAAAVRLTSASAAAEALTATNVVGSYLSERYWPQIHKKADEQAQPGFMPYGNMGPLVFSELDESSAQKWIDQAMNRQGTLSDTHPALAERLKAIGESPRLATPAPGQTADRLLGSALDAVTGEFDRRWHEAILPSWEERHQAVQQGRRTLAELNARAENGPELTLQEAYERATLTESIGNDAEGSITQLRALHGRAPDDPMICFSLGTRLLDRNDASGGALIERSFQRDESLALQGYELMCDYHWRNGREKEAREWQQKLMGHIQILQAADKERGRLQLDEKFDPHGLPDGVITEMGAQLKAIPGVRRAYFMKKRVRHLPRRPCYVLGFGVTRLLQWHSKKRARAVLEQIQETVQFPGETLILNVEGDNYRFGWKFRRMRGARVL